MIDQRPASVEFVFNEDQPERLDKYLVSRLPELSRSRIQALIRDGLVSVNGRLPQKPGQMLGEGTNILVTIPPSQPGKILPESIRLEIVFENEDLIVVNKPAGMVVHPSAGHSSGTLVHAALAHSPEMEGIGGEQRPGVVHRLDKNTSGLILLAKNDQAHRWLQDQFRMREIEKVYLALVDGRPPTPTGRIEAPIGRDPRHRKKMAVVTPEKGRQAVSEYKTLETFPGHTLLEIHPVTGRTHQIRLHLSFLNCPVAGDTIYGNRQSTIPLDRHFLHAARLTLHLPGEQKPTTFLAELPSELELVLERLRQSLKN